MIIDRAKIQKAKEKLGDRTPFLIAELMDLQQFDERNLKALCPCHQEDTPQFIYNPKAYDFYCFGCGKHIDVVDAWMSTGLSFAESAQKLFDEAGVLYSFGELGVKTQRDYRYPTDVEERGHDMIDAYFATRKISRDTLEYCGVKQDDNGNAVFRYFDTNDVLTMVKYRPARKVEHGEPKMWCQKGSDTAPLLFNMNRINTESPLLVTEGEGDSLAAIESGFTNTVSVPLGAHNTHWIEYNLEWLDQFDEIIICADNDDAGRKMVQEVVPRLGSWRTKVVDLPEYVEDDMGKHKIKDINELLYYGGKKAVLNAIASAKDTPVPSVMDMSDVKEINTADLPGVETGFYELDKELMRLFYGTLTLVTGRASSGKTSLLYQIMCNALEQRQNIWMYSKEMPGFMSKMWFNMILAGPRNVVSYEGRNESVYYRLKDGAAQYIDEAYRGNWIVYRDDAPDTADAIKESMEASVRKYGSKLLLIDNLMCIDLGGSTEDRNQKQTEFISWLIRFATKYKVAIILVAHPRKMAVGNTGAVDLYDISGSSNITNLAHRTLSLSRITEEQKQRGDGKYSQYDVVLSVTKDRMRGRNGFEMGLYYDPASRRFYSTYDEYDRVYRWDANRYDDRLPCPRVDDENEVYGVIRATG